MNELKKYLDEIKIEDTAHHVMNSFEEVVGRKLAKDEQEFVMTITKHTFDEYIIENVGDILVANSEEKEKLDKLLSDLVDNIAALMVHWIYSRLEAYVLYNTLKKLKEED